MSIKVADNIPTERFGEFINNDESRKEIEQIMSGYCFSVDSIIGRLQVIMFANGIDRDTMNIITTNNLKNYITTLTPFNVMKMFLEKMIEIKCPVEWFIQALKDAMCISLLEKIENSNAYMHLYYY